MRATLAMIVVGMLALMGCSDEGASATSEDFGEMASDEVGCIVDYGDESYKAGPLGPSDSQAIEPNAYTSFRIGRTASTVIVIAEREDDSSHAGVELVRLRQEMQGEVISQGAMADGGNPGYANRCWAGAL